MICSSTVSVVSAVPVRMASMDAALTPALAASVAWAVHSMSLFHSRETTMIANYFRFSGSALRKRNSAPIEVR